MSSTEQTQINIPELSWTSNPSKSLIENLAFTNSIHIIDLLNYLLPNNIITKVCAGKKNGNFNRIISFEDEKFIGTINLTFGVPDTYSFKVLSDSKVLELEPIESFKSYNKISKIHDSNCVNYAKVLDSKWEMSKKDKKFKPGFVQQYLEFSKFVLDQSSKVNLANMSDDYKAFQVMNRIMAGD